MKQRMEKKGLVIAWEERSGQERRHHLWNTFTYNCVSHRGSNKLLYHKIKGQAMSLWEKEPPRSNFLYFLFENSGQYSGVQFASGSEIKFLNRALWLGVFSFPVTSLLSQLHTSQDINSRYPAKDQMRSKGLHSLAAKKMLGGRDRKLPASVIVEKKKHHAVEYENTSKYLHKLKMSVANQILFSKYK